jgi:hypothetical protein
MAFLFLVLGALALPASARAQDQKETLPAVRLSPDDVLSAETLTPQEKLDRKTFANQYMDRCMTMKNSVMDQATLEETCACHAVHMLASMPTRQIQSLATGKNYAPINKTALFRDVFAPCIEPALAYYQQQACYANPEVLQLVKTENAYEGICACLTEQARIYAREMAQPQIEAEITRNPLLDDPLALVYRSRPYRNEMQDALNECIKLYIP